MNQFPWPADFGRPRTVRPANPAAGANLSITVETNSIWLPVSLQITLVTAVAAATRDMVIVFSDSTGEYIRWFSLTTQTASLTRIYNFGPQTGFDHGVSNTHILNVLLAKNYLTEGDTITTDVLAIQAADQISNVRLRVLEWLHHQV